MSEQSQADVLAAMLRIAEGDIKAKDEQHALLQQIIATNEKEIAAKDGRILELEEEVRALKREMEEFKSLFDMYLNRQEAARATSVYQPNQAKAASGPPPTPTLTSVDAAAEGAAGGGATTACCSSSPSRRSSAGSGVQSLGAPPASLPPTMEGLQQQQQQQQRSATGSGRPSREAQLAPASRQQQQPPPARRVPVGRPDDEMVRAAVQPEEDEKVTAASVQASVGGSTIGDHDDLEDLPADEERELEAALAEELEAVEFEEGAAS
jgi:hypothetical protein